MPYGEDFGESGVQDKHHFTSYERDSETGTDYAVNRQYVQSVGRFMRVDPIRGPNKSPLLLNRYAYAHNDPINSVDPLGLFSLTYCFWNVVELDGPNYLGLDFEGCITFDLPSRPEPAPPPQGHTKCNAWRQLPDDQDGLDAVAVVLGEATPLSRYEDFNYEDGDMQGHATGNRILGSEDFAREAEAFVSVIANRVAALGFPKTWHDVIHQPNAFALARGQGILKRWIENWREEEFYESSYKCQEMYAAIEAVRRVREEGSQYPYWLYWVATIDPTTNQARTRRPGDFRSVFSCVYGRASERI